MTDVAHNFVDANQLALDILSKESFSFADKEASKLPVLSERQSDPWNQPIKQEPSRSAYNGGYSSQTQSNTAYKGNNGYASPNTIIGRVDGICKNLNLVAKEISKANPPEERQNQQGSHWEGDGKVVKRGFWNGVKAFFGNDTTKEVLLVMAIISLKTALVITYVKADQKKVKIAEFL